MTTPSTSKPARTFARTAAITLGAVALAISAGGAQAYGHGYHGGYYHGGYYHGGGWGWGAAPFWGAVGLGLGLAVADDYYRPNYVVVDQPPVYVVPPAPAVVYPSVAQAPAPVPYAAPAPVAAPDLIFYPRNGQTAAQTETDRRACNQWATTQPLAMADASVFQRATLACMDGRGYSGR